VSGGGDRGVTQLTSCWSGQGRSGLNLSPVLPLNLVVMRLKVSVQTILSDNRSGSSISGSYR
jgi:hypothetical protein